jgi:hypothetical protein
MSTSLARSLPFAALVEERRLGALPLVALSGGLGLLVVAVSYTLARLAIPGDGLLWWLGIVAIVAPASARLLSRGASRDERLAIVVVVGLGLYLVKVLHGPSAFLLFDEFHHWATLQDLADTGRLFTPNNILVASPYYPGLEVVTDLLMRAGLPVWESAMLVVGAARVLHVLALFLLFERIGRDARVAGLGVLIYAANPSFLFFDAQFSYESLALPIATLAIWLAVRRESGAGEHDRAAVADGADGAGVVAEPVSRRRPGAGVHVGLTALIVLAIGAVVVTHHVTSIALSALFLAWAAISVTLRMLRRPGAADVLGLGLLTVTTTVAWTLYVASVTVGYLAPAVGTAVNQVVDLVAGEEGGRELFRTATGQSAPAWEQLVAYGSVVLLLALLPLGLLALWRRYQDRSAALMLAGVALVYPLTLLARLTPRGAELSARSSEFVFLGLGFVGALAIVALLERHVERPAIGRPVAEEVLEGPEGERRAMLLSPGPSRIERAARRRRLIRGGLFGALLVLSLGGAALAIPPWARMPGEYLVAADPRSVEPQGIAAATWTAERLGREQYFLSDRTNRVLLATYGRQHPVSAAGDRVDLKRAFFGIRLGRWEVDLLSRLPVRYVIADSRLATALPQVGVYVERGELLGEPAWPAPMSGAALEKWDTVDGSDRIYDGGSIRIYDIGRITGARP